MSQTKLHLPGETFSFKNLLASWDSFKRGKEKKQDVAEFAIRYKDLLDIKV